MLWSAIDPLTTARVYILHDCWRWYNWMTCRLYTTLLLHEQRWSQLGWYYLWLYCLRWNLRACAPEGLLISNSVAHFALKESQSARHGWGKGLEKLQLTPWLVICLCTFCEFTSWWFACVHFVYGVVPCCARLTSTKSADSRRLNRLIRRLCSFDCRRIQLDHSQWNFGRTGAVRWVMPRGRITDAIWPAARICQADRRCFVMAEVASQLSQDQQISCFYTGKIEPTIYDSKPHRGTERDWRWTVDHHHSARRFVFFLNRSLLGLSKFLLFQTHCLPEWWQFSPFMINHWFIFPLKFFFRFLYLSSLPRNGCTGLPNSSRLHAGAILPCSALDVFASEKLARKIGRFLKAKTYQSWD